MSHDWQFKCLRTVDNKTVPCARLWTGYNNGEKMCPYQWLFQPSCCCLTDLQLCIFRPLANPKGSARWYARDYPDCFLEVVLHLCCIFRGAEVFVGDDKGLLHYAVLAPSVTSWFQLLNVWLKHGETLQDKPCATAGKINGLAKCIVCMKEIVARYILLVSISTLFLLLLLMVNTGTSDTK